MVRCSSVSEINQSDIEEIADLATTKKTHPLEPEQNNNNPVSSKLIDNNQNYDIHPNQDQFGINKDAPVHYYMLSLSWSPSFCRKTMHKNNGKVLKKYEFQCVPHPKQKWVIHGLWPQNENARSIKDHPRFCQADLAPVDPNIMQPYLENSPGYALLQGEWEKHGNCAFKTPKDYYQKQQELFDKLVLPTEDKEHQSN